MSATYFEGDGPPDDDDAGPTDEEVINDLSDQIDTLTAQRDALLAACQMEELLASYRARASWSDQQIQFFRRLGELAKVHGWDGNDTPLSEFVRDFRRQTIAAALPPKVTHADLADVLGRMLKAIKQEEPDNG